MCGRYDILPKRISWQGIPIPRAFSLLIGENAIMNDGTVGATYINLQLLIGRKPRKAAVVQTQIGFQGTRNRDAAYLRSNITGHDPK